MRYVSMQVRNGLAMILIYSMSAAKAAHSNSEQSGGAEEDLFTVLQENETGECIAH